MNRRIGPAIFLASLTVGAMVISFASAGQSLRLSFQIDEQDKTRDRDLQPDRVMEVIGLRPGMIVGEAGAWYGYYTFKMSRRVGPEGLVYANDINPAALRTIEDRCAAGRITNVKTVLGVEDDPRFPRPDLDLILVGDCLHMFGRPAEWMAQARKYLKPGGRLVIIDPDRAKTRSDSFLSKQQVWDFAKRAGYTIIETDDAFLKNHMIVILQAASAAYSF
jgi:SAM-dependent methyltransferase